MGRIFPGQKAAAIFAVVGCALGALPAMGAAPYAVGWKAQLGSNDVDQTYDMCVAGSNIYVVGSTDGSLAAASAGSRDVVLANYTTAGTLVWSRQFGTARLDEGCGGVGVDGVGNIYASGMTYGTMAGTQTGGMGVAKFNRAGDVQWKAQFSGQDNTFGMAVDRAGNSFMVGNAVKAGAGGGYDGVSIVKYDSTGVQQWNRKFGSAANDTCFDACVDGAGNVIVTGYTSGAIGGPNGGRRDAFLAKYDTNGNQIWARQLGSSGDDYGWSVVTDAAGDVYMTGGTNGTLGGQANRGDDDVLLAKYNSAGVLQWVNTLGTAGLDRGYGVTLDGKGHVFVTGPTTGALGGANAGGWSVFVAGFDESGVALWNTQIGTSANEYPTGIGIDSAGNLYTTGSTDGALGGTFQGGYNDIFLAEFATDTPEPGSLALLSAGLLVCLSRGGRGRR